MSDLRCFTLSLSRHHTQKSNDWVEKVINFNGVTSWGCPIKVENDKTEKWAVPLWCGHFIYTLELDIQNFNAVRHRRVVCTFWWFNYYTLFRFDGPANRIIGQQFGRFQTNQKFIINEDLMINMKFLKARLKNKSFTTKINGFCFTLGGHWGPINIVKQHFRQVLWGFSIHFSATNQLPQQYTQKYIISDKLLIRAGTLGHIKAENVTTTNPVYVWWPGRGVRFAVPIKQTSIKLTLNRPPSPPLPPKKCAHLDARSKPRRKTTKKIGETFQIGFWIIVCYVICTDSPIPN
jgi:hypothetical protein